MSASKEHFAGKPGNFPAIAKTEMPTRRVIAPKTDFGRELLALRNKAIADGMKVRSAEEILSEIEESRRSW